MPIMPVPVVILLIHRSKLNNYRQFLCSWHVKGLQNNSNYKTLSEEKVPSCKPGYTREGSFTIMTDTQDSLS